MARHGRPPSPAPGTRPLGFSPATRHAPCFSPALRRLQGEQPQARPTGFHESRDTSHETRPFFETRPFCRVDRQVMREGGGPAGFKGGGTKRGKTNGKEFFLNPETGITTYTESGFGSRFGIPHYSSVFVGKIRISPCRQSSASEHCGNRDIGFMDVSSRRITSLGPQVSPSGEAQGERGTNRETRPFTKCAAQAGPGSELFTKHETRNTAFTAVRFSVGARGVAPPETSVRTTAPAGKPLFSCSPLFTIVRHCSAKKMFWASVPSPSAPATRPVWFSRNTNHETRITAFVVARHGAAMARHGRPPSPAPATLSFLFTGRQIFLLERTMPPNHGFHETRNTKHETRTLCFSRNTRHETRITAFILSCPLFPFFDCKLLRTSADRGYGDVHRSSPVCRFRRTSRRAPFAGNPGKVHKIPFAVDRTASPFARLPSHSGLLPPRRTPKESMQRKPTLYIAQTGNVLYFVGISGRTGRMDRMIRCFSMFRAREKASALGDCISHHVARRSA